jgi:iron(III) transport system ATP-binding protein
VRSADIKAQTMRALELVGLAQLADRYATKLSGGQRQRVALARAIVYEPRVVLFDEPLSNLDAKLREQMRVELVRLQQEVGITSIYVTHDQTEALVMSDRVVVMDKGAIQQIGDPHDIYAHPANAFVANFIGATNLLKGVLRGCSDGVYNVEILLGENHAPLHVKVDGGGGLSSGQEVTVSVRPEDLSVHVQAPQASDLGNVFEGEVVDTVYLGNFLECNVRVGDQEIGVQLDHYIQLQPRQKVFVAFAPDRGLCLAE